MWFHVTERALVPFILEEGFAASDGMAGFGTYLWANMEDAEDWIDVSDYEDPAIIAVVPDVPPINVEALWSKRYRGRESADEARGVYLVEHPQGSVWQPPRRALVRT